MMLTCPRCGAELVPTTGWLDLRRSTLEIEHRCGRRWKLTETCLLRELYPDTPTKVIARRLRRPLHQIYAKARNLDLAKSATYLAGPHACWLRRGNNMGWQHRYPKGHTPANKGLRRPGYAPGRMAETQFKAGQRGVRWKPVGSERLVDGYRYTKVSDVPLIPWTRNWRPTHVLRWEKRRGPIPAGHVLVFRNGDRRDVRLANLELTVRSELMRRNTVHNLPKALVGVIQLCGVIQRQINKGSA